jgi:hypothetical protein
MCSPHFIGLLLGYDEKTCVFLDVPIIWHSGRTIFEIGSQANVFFLLFLSIATSHPPIVVLSSLFSLDSDFLSSLIRYASTMVTHSFTSFSDPRWRSQGFRRNCRMPACLPQLQLPQEINSKSLAISRSSSSDVRPRCRNPGQN